MKKKKNMVFNHIRPAINGLIRNIFLKPNFGGRCSASVWDQHQKLYLSNTNDEQAIDQLTYERVCTETLESLNDYFEEIVESTEHLRSSDVGYSDGVLTVQFNQPFGTYVINRQSPNKQIWLSSPTSGPKRYDFVGSTNTNSGKWVYKHTGESLHDLLQKEIKKIAKQDINFFKLPYSKV